MLNLDFFKDLLNRLGVSAFLGAITIYYLYDMCEKQWLAGHWAMIGMVVTLGLVLFYRKHDPKLSEEEPECECDGEEPDVPT